MGGIKYACIARGEFYLTKLLRASNSISRYIRYKLYEEFSLEVGPFLPTKLN